MDWLYYWFYQEIHSWAGQRRPQSCQRDVSSRWWPVHRWSGSYKTFPMAGDRWKFTIWSFWQQRSMGWWRSWSCWIEDWGGDSATEGKIWKGSISSGWNGKYSEGHFRVLLCLCIKTSLSVKPFIWKWVLQAVLFSCKSKSFSHLDSFWNRGTREFGMAYFGGINRVAVSTG